MSVVACATSVAFPEYGPVKFQEEMVSPGLTGNGVAVAVVAAIGISGTVIVVVVAVEAAEFAGAAPVPA
jgi:hypothetical protein